MHCSFVAHDDDVYQVSGNALQYLLADEYSCYSRSYDAAIKTLVDMFPSEIQHAAPHLVKINNPLHVLQYFASTAY